MIKALRRRMRCCPRALGFAFLDDPFDGWDMLFLAQLWYDDPKLDVTLGRKLERPLTSEELRGFTRVFRFKGTRLVE